MFPKCIYSISPELYNNAKELCYMKFDWLDLAAEPINLCVLSSHHISCLTPWKRWCSKALFWLSDLDAIKRFVSRNLP